MRVGLAGAHRTGKSTIAAEVAAMLGFPFVASYTTDIATRLGFDINKDNSFARRLDYQTHVLNAMEESFSKRTMFISDRTPLDAAAYLLSEVKSFTGDQTTQELANQYIDRARKMTSNLFDIVIVVPPAISVEPMPGKPLVNPAFQEHIHFLVCGMLFDPDIDVKQGQLLRDNTDQADRVAAVFEFMKEWEQRDRLDIAA